MDTTYIDSATSFDTWVDQSDNSHDLTAGATNEPAFNFGDSDSEYNPFLRFDGSDDYLSVANHTDFNFGANTDFTLELIIKTSATDGGNTVGKGSIGGVDKSYLFPTQDNGTIRLRLDDDTDTVTIDSTTVINDGEWHHCFAVVDRNGNAQIYIDDGSAEGAASITSIGDIDDAAQPLAIGTQPDLSSDPFDGDIALVRIWNRALSSAERLVQYNSGDFWQIAAPTADQWGDQAADNVSACENGTQPYDTFDGVSATGFHAIKTTTGAGQARCATADEIPLIINQKYNVNFTATLTSGTAPEFDLRRSKTDSVARSIEGEQEVVAGSNFFTFTANETPAGAGVVQFNSGTGDVAEFTIANLLVSASGCVAEWRLAHANAFSPFEFPKGRQLPVNFPIVPRQIVGVAGGGQTVVDDLGDADERFPINVLRVSATVRTNLLGFLQDSTVNYREQSFQFVEEDATDNEVRLWEPFPLDFPRVPGSLFNIALTVRKEIS